MQTSTDILSIPTRWEARAAKAACCSSLCGKRLCCLMSGAVGPRDLQHGLLFLHLLPQLSYVSHHKHTGECRRTHAGTNLLRWGFWLRPRGQHITSFGKSQLYKLQIIFNWCPCSCPACSPAWSFWSSYCWLDRSSISCQRWIYRYISYWCEKQRLKCTNITLFSPHRPF